VLVELAYTKDGQLTWVMTRVLLPNPNRKFFETFIPERQNRNYEHE
jgi:hypothetical protein